MGVLLILLNIKLKFVILVKDGTQLKEPKYLIKFDTFLLVRQTACYEFHGWLNETNEIKFISSMKHTS